MAKKSCIVIIFGTGGSGKTFVVDELVKDSRFEHISKPSTRKFENFEVQEKGSVNISAKPFGLSVISKEDIIESDLSSENNGAFYSIPVGEIDRTILENRVPVIILRSKEQMQMLQKMYPKQIIKKFYIRPHAEALKSYFLNNKSKTAQEITKRFEQIAQEYFYYDQLADSDKSVEILMHSYSGAERMIDVIKSVLSENKLLPDEEDSNRTQEVVAKKIIFGDKIRISLEEDLNKNSANFGKMVWYAKVIRKNKVRGNVYKNEHLNELVMSLIENLWNAKIRVKHHDKLHAELIKNVFSKINYELGSYEISLEEKRLETILKNYENEILSLTNQQHLLRRENGKLLGKLIVPRFVLDIDFNHLGFEYSLASLMQAKIAENMKKTREKHSIYHPIGYVKTFKPVRIKDFSMETLYKALEKQLDQIKQYERNQSQLNQLENMKENTLSKACASLEQEWEQIKAMNR